MTVTEDVRGQGFWRRELAELAAEFGSTASDELRARQASFLSAYARRGGKAVAAAEIGVTIGTITRWTREDPVFAKAGERAWDAYSEVLIDEATRRAVEGVEVLVRDRHGAIVGEERKYSDDLIKFLLKGLDSRARWAQRNEAGPAKEGAWRSHLLAVLGNDEARAKLEELAELVANRKGTA